LRYRSLAEHLSITKWCGSGVERARAVPRRILTLVVKTGSAHTDSAVPVTEGKLEHLLEEVLPALRRYHYCCRKPIPALILHKSSSTASFASLFTMSRTNVLSAFAVRQPHTCLKRQTRCSTGMFSGLPVHVRPAKITESPVDKARAAEWIRIEVTQGRTTRELFRM
jgi:hypothetical protein